ncbi:MAG: hypothetical protein JWM95_44 [Gemmatimonadetes bacterium]|nr:hypothetical protein [Gemmatimonadota bacterium]
MTAYESPGHTGRLRPPTRGDYIGLFLTLVGLSVFVTSVVLQPPWRRADLSGELLLLNLFSLALTTFGFVWSVFKDLKWLHREELDIDFVLRLPEGGDIRGVLKRRNNEHGGFGGLAFQVLRLAPTGGSIGVETLLDDRASRVFRVKDGSADEGTVQEAELRAIAISRSSFIGSAARYVAGLLLLLTVLGTFIGVKEALPGLVQALRSAGTSEGIDPSQMAAALDNVRSAFGSNLSALLGSIALGLAAFGLGTGRQMMLARLEQASGDLYLEIRRSAGGSTLSAAITQLADASGKMIGVADTLDGFKDAIDDFSSASDQSLAGTRQMLTTLLDQQHGRLAERNREEVTRLERQMTETATAVQQATLEFTALVATLRNQDGVVKAMTDRMDRAIAQMDLSRSEFSSFADGATRTISDRLEQLARGSRRQARFGKQAVEQYEFIHRGLEQMIVEAGALSQAVASAESLRIASAENLARVTAELVAGMINPSVTLLTEKVGALPEGVSIGVREGLKDVIKDATSQSAREAARAVVAESQPDREATAPLQRSLDQLTRSLRALNAEMSVPLWRRVVRLRRSEKS